MNPTLPADLRAKGASLLLKLVMLGLALSLFLALREMHDWHESYAPSQQWAAELGKRPRPWTPTLVAAANALTVRAPKVSYRTADELFGALMDEIDAGRATATTDPLLQAYVADRAALSRARAASAASIEGMQAEFEGDQRDYDCVTEELAHYRKQLAGATPEQSARFQAAIGRASTRRVAIQKSMADRTAERRSIDGWYQPQITDLRTRVQDARTAMRNDFNAVHVAARPVPRLLASSAGVGRFILEVGDSSDALHSLYTAVWYGLQVIVAGLFFFALLPLLRRLGAGKDDESILGNVKKWLAGAFAGGSRVAPVIAAAAAAGLTLAAMEPLAGQTPFHADPPVADSDGAAGSQGKRGSKGATGDAGEHGLQGAQGLPGENAKLPDDLEGRLGQVDTLQKMLDDLRADILRASDRIGTIETKKLPERTSQLELTADAANRNLTSLTEVSGKLASVSAGLAEVDRGLLAQQETIEKSITTELPLIREQATNASNAAGEAASKAGQIQTAMAAYEGHVDQLLDQNAVWDDRGFWRSLVPLRQYAAGPAAIQIVKHDLAGRGYAEPVATAMGNAMTAASGGIRYRWRFQREVIDAIELTQVDDAMKATLRDAVDLEMPLILKVCRLPR